MLGGGRAVVLELARDAESLGRFAMFGQHALRQLALQIEARPGTPELSRLLSDELIDTHTALTSPSGSCATTSAGSAPAR